MKTELKNKFGSLLFIALIFFTAYQLSNLKVVSVKDLHRLKPANQGVTLKP